MTAPPQFPLARHAAGVSPLLRPGSVRRTTSIDSTWPDGAADPWLMEGRARDLFCPADGSAPVVLDQASYRLRISPRREILELVTSPADERARQLIGVRAGGESRRQIAAVLADRTGSPLYQILDDFAGASLVGRWIWSQWHEDWLSFTRMPEQQSHGRNGDMLDICTGFAAGSSALRNGMESQSFREPAEVGPLENPLDPGGWHAMPEQSGPAMRRARRMDIWRQDDLLMIDAGFQDSGTSPIGGRRGVHEYRVYAEIDPTSGILLAMQVLPHILPFQECPGAAIKASRMIGKPLAQFRDSVLDTLPATLGCTHLNDVLRAFADAPALARHLP
ncbi:MAG TPA: DUF2889 domain-containing protein [Novosphingobium sp.]